MSKAIKEMLEHDFIESLTTKQINKIMNNFKNNQDELKEEVERLRQENERLRKYNKFLKQQIFETNKTILDFIEEYTDPFSKKEDTYVSWAINLAAKEVHDKIRDKQSEQKAKEALNDTE